MRNGTPLQYEYQSNGIDERGCSWSQDQKTHIRDGEASPLELDM